jgi:hypothetical protein
VKEATPGVSQDLGRAVAKGMSRYAIRCPSSEPGQAITRALATAQA